MHLSCSIPILVAAYLGLNFVCALLLHRHADRQAHLPLRRAEVFVHFVLLTAVGIPLLLLVTAVALFAGPDPEAAALGRTTASATVGAHAA